jgi:hypothetical protein
MRKGRENRKKSTAPASVFDRRSHEAFCALKIVTFLTYTVTTLMKTPTPRITTSPGENSTSPGLVPTSPGLVLSRHVLRFSPSDGNIYSHLTGIRRGGKTSFSRRSRANKSKSGIAKS